MRQSTEDKWLAMAREAAENRRCIVALSHSDRATLARLKSAGLFASPMRGMFVESAVWERLKHNERTAMMARTLEARYPNWVFCSNTAAAMHGLWVASTGSLPLHVATTPSKPTKSTKAIVRHPMENPDYCEIDGVKVTSLEQTLLDCLAGLEFPAGLALADSALRLSGMPREHFMAYARQHPEVSRGGFALDCLAHSDRRSESGGESIARAVMIEQGFKVPDLQVRIDDPIEPANHYRVDYLWHLPDGSLVAGELDGREKYVNPEMTGGREMVDVLADERLRESRLSAAGLRVVRFSYADVKDVRRFARLLEAYGIPRGPARPRGRLRF